MILINSIWGCGLDRSYHLPQGMY